MARRAVRPGLDDRCPLEVAGEGLGIDGGRGDDELEIQAWREPLSVYRGVQRNSQPWHSQHRAATMIYSIRLVHPDASKTVLLYEAENSLHIPPADREEKWKAYCRLFHLPALEDGERRELKIDADALDTPLAKQLRTGRIAPPPVMEMVLATGIVVERDGDGWLFTLLPSWPVRPFAIFGVFGGGMLVFAYLLGLLERGPLVIVTAASATLVAAVAVFTYGSLRRRRSRSDRVLVDRRFLWYRYWDGVRDREITERMPLAEIIEISIRPDPSRGKGWDDVVVRGTNRTLRFGNWLPLRSKTGCVITCSREPWRHWSRGRGERWISDSAVGGDDALRGGFECLV